MASPYRILLVVFAVSVIHTFVDGEDIIPGTTEKATETESPTSTTTQRPTVGGQRIVECSVRGSWPIPSYGEVNIPVSCYSDCSRVRGIDISMLSLKHPSAGDLIVSLHKGNRQVVIKDHNRSCGPDYDEIYIQDVAEGGFLDEICGPSTISSPPSYLPLEPLSHGFQGVQGCGEWILNVTNPRGYGGFVTGIAMRYVTES
ncbi:unnamed protein product [Cyprideis torosa]|uniref:Uncharacterized protein n=1 Tax=Cyprideis torosa TaxID=163714 RepID=A0A7R8WHH0_9CRUS|nr:unnamed protein product [Cyprideis torosa]CAG0899391.1 unnamed protein product [Cyprideis torosa]